MCVYILRYMSRTQALFWFGCALTPLQVKASGVASSHLRRKGLWPMEPGNETGFTD